MRPGANVFTLLPPGLNPKNAGRGEQTFVKSTFLSTSEKLSLRAKSTFTRLSCLILLWISFVPIPSTVTNAGSGTTVSRPERSLDTVVRAVSAAVLPVWVNCTSLKGLPCAPGPATTRRGMLVTNG